jgi:hypothetical protein
MDGGARAKSNSLWTEIKSIPQYAALELKTILEELGGLTTKHSAHPFQADLSGNVKLARSLNMDFIAGIYQIQFDSSAI